MLAPLTPPPTTTTSAVSAITAPISRAARRRCRSGPRVDVAGVEGIAGPVAEEVEARDRQRDHHPGEDRHPRSRREVALGIVEHVAPARQRRLDAIAKEADVGLKQDGARPPEGGGPGEGSHRG